MLLGHFPAQWTGCCWVGLFFYALLCSALTWLIWFELIFAFMELALPLSVSFAYSCWAFHLGRRSWEQPWSQRLLVFSQSLHTVFQCLADSQVIQWGKKAVLYVGAAVAIVTLSYRVNRSKLTHLREACTFTELKCLGLVTPQACQAHFCIRKKQNTLFN